MGQEYKIQLGINFNDGELKNVKKQLTGLTDDTHRIRIDIDNSRLLKQVAHAKKELRSLNGLGGSKGNAPVLKMNTESVENALNRVADSIDEIRASLNTLDGKSGMQSLVASVNQIASALGKATDESETLVKTLSALGKKDFSFNIDLKLGGSNSFSNTAAYGDYVRRTAIPELRKQADSLMKAIREQYKDEFFSWQSDDYVLDTLSRRKSYNPAKSVGLLQKEMIDGKNLSKQMAAYNEFINLVEDVGNLSGVDMGVVSSGFSRTKDEIIQNAFDIQSGVKNAVEGTEESAKKLKNIFGASIDADALSAQLEPITKGLTDIKVAIEGLSKIDSLNNLTQTFSRLSDVLDGLSANLAQIERYFDGIGNMGNGLDSSVDNASQGLKGSADILEKFKRSLQNIGMGTDEIDRVANRIQNLGIQIETLDQKITRAAAGKGKRNRKGANNLLVDVSGTDKDGNIVKFTEQYDIATGKLVKSTEDVSTVQQKAGKSTNKFIKQQKQAVAGFEIDLQRIQSRVADQGIGKPIKNQTHINALEIQYGEVDNAIQKLRNSTKDTFTDTKIEVEKAIAVLENLERQYRNAESVATSLRSKDFDTVKATYADKLDEKISKMQGAGVYESEYGEINGKNISFKERAEQLRTSLSSAGDKNALVSFLNELDKLESAYKKAKVAKDEFNRSKGVGADVDKLRSTIENIQRISPEISDFKTKINGAEVGVQDLLNKLGQVKTSSDFRAVKKEFSAFEEAAKAAGIAVTEATSKTKNELAKQIKIDLQTGEFKTQVNGIEQDAKKLSGTYKEIDGSIAKLNQALSNMKTAAAQGDVDGLIKSYKEYKAALKAVENQIDQNRMAEKNATDLTKLNQKKQSLSLEMKNWLKDNSAAAKDFGARIRELQSQIDACDDASLGNLRREFQNIKKEAQLAGKTTKTVGDRIKEQFAQYSTYLGVAEIFMWAEQGLRDMFEQVKLIDSAMTELKKVTNETDATYNKFLTNAGSRAKEIGTTIDGLVNSTADFARLGYEFADAQGLAEVANIYAVVGDDIDSVEAATQSLISTLTAFKDEAGDLSESDFALSIVDKMNEVSNNFAISSGGLGDALQRSASSMMAANNSLDETIALITAAM